MSNAELIAQAVAQHPGLTAHALMRTVRRGRPSRLSYWYRDVMKALNQGLIEGRMEGRYSHLYPVEVSA